jgi:hypothetical protein
MDVRGATITAYGTVDSKREYRDWGIVGCSIGVRGEDSAVTTTGSAEVLLPRSGGPPVPYPLPADLSEVRTSMV